MMAREVVDEWFSAHRAGDLDRARALLRHDATIRVPDGDLVGFDALMDWYARRAAAAGPQFGYETIETIPGERHVAVLILLHDDAHRWRQIAVYEVEGGVIASIWAAEESTSAGLRRRGYGRSVAP